MPDGVGGFPFCTIGKSESVVVQLPLNNSSDEDITSSVIRDTTIARRTSHCIRENNCGFRPDACCGLIAVMKLARSFQKSFRFWLLISLMLSAAAASANEPCRLDQSPVEQARCLLRPVKKYGNLDGPLPGLPSPLESLIGKSSTSHALRDRFKRWLQNNEIAEADIGGAVNAPLEKARYFVIHDTSTYIKDAGAFPSNINDDTWFGNDLKKISIMRVTHVWVNRLGQSATTFDFNAANPPNGTKFGRDNPDKRGWFLHVENVQPRKCDLVGEACCKIDAVTGKEACNDARAPEPGFTDSQYKRLAVLYVAASIRHGSWLIPAYHAAVDAGYRDAHDDPQNFDLVYWANSLNKIIKEIQHTKFRNPSMTTATQAGKN